VKNKLRIDFVGVSHRVLEYSLGYSTCRSCIHAESR